MVISAFGALLLQLAGARAFAQMPTPVSVNSSEDSYWTNEIQPPSSGQKNQTASQGATQPSNPSMPEKIGFWDQLQNKVFDEWCSQVNIPVSKSLTQPFTGGSTQEHVSYDRYLTRLISGNWAVVDDAKISVNLGVSKQIYATPTTPPIGVGIGVSAGYSGESMIMRPLDSKKSCHELKKLINVFDMKTTIPFTARRFSKMEVGELWKMPFVLTFGPAVSASVGIPSVSPVTPNISISLSGSTTDRGQTSVTVYRMSQKELRFRLRFDNAVFIDRSAGLSASIPIPVLALPATLSWIDDIVDPEIQSRYRSLFSYINLTLGYSADNNKGDKSVIEFVLDPDDSIHMDALASLLRGEIGALQELAKMSKDVKAMLSKEETRRLDVRGTKAAYEARLMASSSFVGLEEYQNKSKGWSASFPLLFFASASKSREKNKIISLESSDKSSVVDFQRSDRFRQHGFLNIPYMGQISKRLNESTAQSFVYMDSQGTARGPAGVYIEQDGFLRAGKRRAFKMARRIDSLMKLAGAELCGTDSKMALPPQYLAPPSPILTEPEQKERRQHYKTGQTSLTIGFGEEAIEQILSAGPLAVVRAFTRTLSGSLETMMEWVIKNGAISEAGIDFNEQAFSDAMGLNWTVDGHDDAERALSEIRAVCELASGVIYDLVAARKNNTPQARAKSFLNLLSGDGKSGLAYHDILEILIQFVDPTNLTSEYYMHLNGGGQKKRKIHDVDYRLNLRGAKADEIINKVSGARSRFAEPSKYTD